MNCYLPVERMNILKEIHEERVRQDSIWGEQNHPVRDPVRAQAYYNSLKEFHQKVCDLAAETKTLSWEYILLEEVFEALAETEPDKQRHELIQAIAVGVAAVECIDRKNRPSTH